MINRLFFLPLFLLLTFSSELEFDKNDTCNISSRNTTVVLEECKGKKYFNTTYKPKEDEEFKLKFMGNTIAEINELFKNAISLNTSLDFIELQGEGQISFPNLVDFICPLYKAELTIREVKNLSTISFPKITTINANYVGFKENPQLKTISFGPSLKVIKLNRFVIYINDNLEKFQIDGDQSSLPITEVRQVEVRGNPKLIRPSIDLVKNVFKNSSLDIQELGECKQNWVRNLAKLDNCKYILGNLNIEDNSYGKTTARLQSVKQKNEEEKIEVFTNELAPDDLGFLKEAKIYGRLKSKLCNFNFSQFNANEYVIDDKCIRPVPSPWSLSSTPVRQTTVRQSTPIMTIRSTTEELAPGEEIVTAATSTGPSSTGILIPTTEMIGNGFYEVEASAEVNEKSKNIVTAVVTVSVVLLMVMVGVCVFSFWRKSKNNKASKNKPKAKSEIEANTSTPAAASATPSLS